MPDYVICHFDSEVGYPAMAVRDFRAFTAKTVTDVVIGGRLWLITKDEATGHYFLRMWFRIQDVIEDPSVRLSTELRGSEVEGAMFDPMPRIDNRDWFESFKNTQGNFAFGFRPILPQYVLQFELAAS